MAAGLGVFLANNLGSAINIVTRAPAGPAETRVLTLPLLKSII